MSSHVFGQSIYTMHVMFLVFKFMLSSSLGTGKGFGLAPAVVDISIIQDTMVKIKSKGGSKACMCF